ncbi:hypothetical protein PLESTM_000088800 [Pleodorina starrii]|nr:hypothetical protein PLESTM_000088800 [Pleodorina starrii]
MSRSAPQGAPAWSASYVPVPSNNGEASNATPSGAPTRTPPPPPPPSPPAAPPPAPVAAAPLAPAAPLAGRACYFLLGAGLLAAWNALITATDYFGAVYPGWHTDRLFTVSYLPTCLVFLAVAIRFPDLLSSAVRVRLGYLGFTAAMAAVPLLDALLMAPSGAGGGGGSSDGGGSTNAAAAAAVTAGAAAAAAPVGGLVAVVLCVALVGACDGLCQGALFGEAAQLPPPYMQALVSGTASSGLLVCLLRLASKASFEVDAEDRARGLRDGTRLYFALAGLLSLSCLVVYDGVLARLRISPSRGPPDAARDNGSGGSEGGGEDHEHVYEQASEHQPLLLPLPVELSKECSSTGIDVAAAAAATPEAADCYHWPSAASHCRGVDPWVVDCASRADMAAAAMPATSSPNHNSDTRSGGSGGSGGGSGGSGSGGGGGADVPMLDGITACSTDGGSGGGGVRQQIRRCLAPGWPLCCSLFVTYTVTLSIFPGFLAEDVHSAELGDWYPILLITAYNLADLLGKSLPCLDPIIAAETPRPPPPPPPTTTTTTLTLATTRPQRKGADPEGGPQQQQQQQQLQLQWDNGNRNHNHLNRLNHCQDYGSHLEDLQQGVPLLPHSQRPGKGSGSGGGNGGAVDCVGGACGRLAAAAAALLAPLRRPRGLLAASLLRGVVALPAFLAAARWQAAAWVMAALTAALGLSNGYLTAQALTMGPAFAAALTAPSPPPPPPTPQKAPAAARARLPAGSDGGIAAAAAGGRYGYLPLTDAESGCKRVAGAAAGPQSVTDPAPLPLTGVLATAQSSRQGSEPAPGLGLGLPGGLGPRSGTGVHGPGAAGSAYGLSRAQRHSDAEVVETLLVLSLVAGLNAGAYLGWLWLLKV